nr:FG-GAP-like repeat-containing protein [Candidatus Sigynarchaeota archaeon]
MGQIRATSGFSGQVGTLAWSCTLGGIETSPVIADVDANGHAEVIYMWTGLGRLYCLHGINGTMKWQYSTGSPSYSSPAVGDVDGDGDLEVIVGSDNYRVYCINARNGSLEWSYLTGQVVQAGPAIGDVDGDEQVEIIIGSFDNQVYCLNGKNGSKEWSYITGGDIYSTPAIGDVDGDGIVEVYFGSYDSIVYCLYGNNGSVRWSYTTAGTIRANPAIADVDGNGKKEVLIPCMGLNSRMYCFYGNNVTIKWSYLAPNVLRSSPAVADVDSDGILEAIFGCLDSKVYSLNAINGSEEWTHSTTVTVTNQVYSSPAVGDIDLDGTYEIVVGSQRGYFFCLSGTDGHEEWKYYLGLSAAWSQTSPNIGDMDDDGKLEVLAGRDDVGLYCLIGNGSTTAIPKPWPMWGRDQWHQANAKDNDYKPRLTSGTVNPPSGNQLVNFNFSVVFTDNDNDFPSSIHVVINGTKHVMNKVNLSDKVFTNGCTYYYNTTLPIGNYQYYYQCADGFYTNTTQARSLIVGVQNDFDPVLSNNELHPIQGYNSSTDFTYSVIYSDADNNPPSSVIVSINGTSHPLLKENASDINYMDGCKYLYTATLINIGNYTYRFDCSDGSRLGTLGPFSGPEVKEIHLKNYYMILKNPFTWIDATGGIRANMNGVYDKNQRFDLPFVARLYDKSYDYFYVSTNGFVSFTNITTGMNVFFPRSEYPLMISPFWKSLKTSSPCNVFVMNLTSPNRVVVEWNTITNAVDRLVGSFQMILYESGDIVFNYDYLVYVSAPTCGLNYGYNTAYYNLFTGLNATISDYSIKFTLDQNNYAPALSVPSLNPASGNQATAMNFSVVYSDQDNNAPVYVNAVINGTQFTMQKEDVLDDVYSDGCVYYRILYLQPGTHSYYFNTADFRFTSSTILYTGLVITSTNVQVPVLSSGIVTPATGYADATIFDFRVDYFDADNNRPASINVTIDGVPHAMARTDPQDTWFVDGCAYSFQSTLTTGIHDFYYNCSDGSNLATLDPGVNITVRENTLRNYTLYLNQPYVWIDMTGAVQVPLGGVDGGALQYHLPFEFKVYNYVSRTIWVNVNGFITLLNFAGDYNTAFPDPTYKNMIAPYWSDLLAAYPSNIFIKNLTTPNRVVVEWRDIENVDGITIGSFQVILHESCDVIFNFDYISNASDYVCGLNYGYNTSFYTPFAGLNSSINDYSILFSQDYPWSNHPMDMLVLQNSTSSITWNLATTKLSGYYRVLLNSSLYQDWQAWAGNGMNFNIPIDSNRGRGYWDYKIEFNDSLGMTGSPDIVRVTVNDFPVVFALDLNNTAIIQNQTGVMHWTIEDLFKGSGTYRVLINGSVYVNWSPWTSMVPFSVPVETNTGFGNFNYTLQYRDLFGSNGLENYAFILVVDRPTVDHPADLIVLQNSPGVEINWTMEDRLGEGYFRVLINGTPSLSWSPWFDSTPMAVPVDTMLAIGYWNYTIEYNNSRGVLGIIDTVIVLLDDLPEVVSAPVNVMVAENEAGKTIFWTLKDDIGAGNYTIFVNGTALINNAAWINNTAFSVPIFSSLGLGGYNYTIRYCDSHGFEGVASMVWIIIDDRPVVVFSSSNSIAVLQNTSGFTINWSLHDSSGSGNFSLTRNGVIIVTNGSWIETTEIVHSVNTTLPIGRYTYRLSFWDVHGHSGIPGMINVTIDDVPTILSKSADMTVVQNSSNAQISWIIVDGISAGRYTVYLDGQPLATQNNRPWANSSSIFIAIDTNRGIGIFNYTIMYWDGNGFAGAQSVILITVQASESGIDAFIKFLNQYWLYILFIGAGIVVVAVSLAANKKKKIKKGKNPSWLAPAVP